jgi:hypothetical protein
MQRCPKPDEAEAFALFCRLTRLVDAKAFEFRDRPDYASTDVGIELVEYHRDAVVHSASPSGEREREHALGNLVARARSLHQTKGGAPVHVYLFPGPVTNRLGAGAPQRLQSLVQTLVCNQTIASSDREPTRCRLGPDRVPTDVAGWLGELWVTLAPSWDEARWEFVEANFNDVVVTAVETVIARKEPLVSAYREVTPAVWLVVYTSSMPYVGDRNEGRWSTAGKITPQLRAASFASGFDRVFFLDRESEQCATLDIRPLAESRDDALL